MAMWDTNELWLKAKVFVDRAAVLTPADPDFGLWSALALELLARAALAKVHPTLNADPQNYKNLLYACNIPIVEQPRSIPAHAVYIRLEHIVPKFGKPQKTLCEYMSLLRNTELHTGDPAFAGVNPDTWLPRYYAVTKILCEWLGKSLVEFLGEQRGELAERVVTAFSAESEKAVKDKVAAHAKLFSEKPSGERVKLAQDSELRTLLLFSPGTVRRKCPACGSWGVLTGELVKELQPVYEGGQLLMDIEYLATEFRCLACELHLRTIDEVAHAGLNLHFTERVSTELHTWFQPEEEDPYMNM